MDGSFLTGMAGSLIFSIFLSGIEVAFLSANREQIRLQAVAGNVPARIMAFFVRKPTWFIGTTLIGNIASLLLFGIFATLSVLSWYESRFSPLTLTNENAWNYS